MSNCNGCGTNLDQNTTTWYRQQNRIFTCNSCLEESKTRKTNKDSDYRDRLKVNDPVKYSCQQMRSSSQKRAKALGWAYDLSTDFLISIAPTKCPVLDQPLKYGGGAKTIVSASLDRIDSNEGYTKGNVQIISSLANAMKSEASAEQQLLFAKWILKNEYIE